MQVRAVEANEWEAFRDLRLRALADAPDAFRTTYEEASAMSDEEWAEMGRTTAEHPDAVSWLVESDGERIGQTFSRRIDGGADLGIYGMWVAPEGRGRGVGRALLDAAESWGRERGCTRALLWVADGNASAERLYRNAGYQPTGDGQRLREGSELFCFELAKEL